MSLQSEVTRELKDGITAREVYHRALEYIKDKKPELEKHFVKNLGSAVRNCYLRVCPANIKQIGVEFRDSTYVLSAKNGRRLKNNMVFNLALGFSDLQDEGGKKLVLSFINTQVFMNI